MYAQVLQDGVAACFLVCRSPIWDDAGVAGQAGVPTGEAGVGLPPGAAGVSITGVAWPGQAAGGAGGAPAGPGS
jgi:hypothetical protein